jgi:phage gp36-like protein
MAWITLVEADVVSRLSSPETAALKSAALATGQADPLAEIVSQVIQEVRGYVAAHRANQLGAGETIPDRLKSAALALIRWRLVNRLPVKGLLTEERAREREEAITLLRDVAAGRFAIDAPTTLTDEVESATAPAITARDRTFTRDDEDGL